MKRALLPLPLLGVVACATTGEDSVDLGDPVPPLVLPDTTGIDFPAAFRDAVQLSKSVHAGRAWDGHVAALDRRFSDCPNLYAGAPDVEGADVGGDDVTGASWYDDCTTPGNIGFSGYAWWEGVVAVEGDEATPEGATIDASRTLTANGVIGDGDGVGFEFSGEATDALARVVAPKYDRWSWSSTVTGTLTGSDVFEAASATPGGWRTDLTFYASGGDVSVYEPRGNVYLFDTRLHERFDSIEMDLAFAGPGAVGPDDCALEPRGWIGLRDENAYWYDVVFLPRYEEDASDTGTGNEPYTTCDGCGTLYVRGVQAAELGEVCLDFGFVFDEDPLTPPDVANYVLSLHTLQSEAP